MITNQTPSRLLSLIILCAALWLVAACGSDCQNNVTAPEQIQDTSVESISQTRPPTKEETMRRQEMLAAMDRAKPMVDRARAIRHKYDALFWRQPNVHGVGIGRIRDENGQRTGAWGFIIHVTEKVDQSTLPPEDRIPDMLEGVVVEIREEPPLEFYPATWEDSNSEESNGKR